ncbi:hypothetical protein [Lysinibacillus capsici]|uniref:hypothetical protein n=1 Tax=Lysinibacillus capsici TaxID=2115968 RepID=UPI003082154D|nr:hypothetical protein ICJ70_13715 [Lysinibacillus capsici]
MNKEEIKPIIVPSYSEEKVSKKSFFKKYPFFQKNKTAKKKVERKSHVLRKTPMIMPFLDITEDYIVMKKGYFMDIFQITPNDLHSLTDDDITIKLLEKARFYRSSASQHKVVGLNFPANTEKQRLYWERKKERTTDPLRIRFINRKLFELEFLERERTNREFFLFIYAESAQTLEDEKKQVVRGLRQSFPLQSLSIEKKQDILFMMSNQNSK